MLSWSDAGLVDCWAIDVFAVGCEARQNRRERRGVTRSSRFAICHQITCPHRILSCMYQESFLAEDFDESKCPIRGAGNLAFTRSYLARGIDSSGIQAN